MNKSILGTIAVVLLAATAGALALLAEVKSSNEHYTEAQYRKFVGPCMTEAREPLNTNAKIQKWLNRCIPDKAGTKVVRRTGWARRRSQTGRNGKPWVNAWNPKDPRAYNIYQSCLGKFYTSCEQKCGTRRSITCLPQCKENLRNCVLTYYYHVVIAQKCYPGVQWFNPTPKHVWLPAQAVMDDRKMPHLYDCLAPLANKMSFCRDCHQLERCVTVCRKGYLKQIRGAKNIAQCVSGCRGFFFGGANFKKTGKRCRPGPCYPFP